MSDSASGVNWKDGDFHDHKLVDWYEQVMEDAKSNVEAWKPWLDAQFPLQVHLVGADGRIVRCDQTIRSPLDVLELPPLSSPADFSYEIEGMPPPDQQRRRVFELIEVTCGCAFYRERA